MTDTTSEPKTATPLPDAPATPAELARLYEERKELNARIRAAKSKAKAKDRTVRNRRGVLTGLAIIEWLETHSDSALADQVQRTRDWWLKKPEERALFGLPPLPGIPTTERRAKSPASPPPPPQLVVENAATEAA